MNIWSLAEGIGILVAGILIVIFQAKNWIVGRQDTVGWELSFLFWQLD